MPNYCDYEMRIKGYPANVGRFIEVIRADYNYNKKSYFYNHPHQHMFRVFEAEPLEVKMEGLVMVATITGYCAWSVYSCMLPGFCTYYNDTVEESNKNEFNIRSNQRSDYLINGKIYATHLLNLAKQLNLYLEVYSNEPGMCFQEHYIINNFGQFIVNEEVQTNCYYIEEYDTLKEYNKGNPDYQLDITEDEYLKLKNQGLSYLEYSPYYDNNGYNGIWNFNIDQLKGRMVKRMVAWNGEPLPRKDIFNKEENKNG